MKLKHAQSLLTKFYYEGNQLHFQIMLQSNDAVEVQGDYSDYNAYRNAYDALHKAMNEKSSHKLFAEKSVQDERGFAKVA